MNTTRTEDLQKTQSQGDQEDWDLEILQALVSPSTAEDAALACAAAWMNFLHADRVAVVIFDSSTTCIVAHGQRDNDTHIAIYVGRENASIGALLQPELLVAKHGPCLIESPTDVVCWPEHLSAVFAVREEAAVEDDRVELIKTLSRKLLSRWTTPSTSFANPDHMDSLAEFAAGAGHEINNPLGSIIGQTQLLLKREERADHRQALETIGAQAWRIRDMIGDTMLFARPPQPQFATCSLNGIVEKVISGLSAKLQRKSNPIRFSPKSDLAVFADETQLAVLISHLVRNACEAVEEPEQPGQVTVDIRREGGHAAYLEVTDNGPIIPPDIRQHLFDPFFSGRQAGRGLGFGLCHAWQITRMHNGILLQESLQDGNRFIVVLPIGTGTTSGP